MENKMAATEPSPLAGRLAEMKKRPKPRLEVHASMEAPFGSDRHDWRAEEIQRLKSEIAAIEKELSSWDDVSVGKRARKSLEADKAVKVARIMEHKASMKKGRRGIF